LQQPGGGKAAARDRWPGRGRGRLRRGGRRWGWRAAAGQRRARRPRPGGVVGRVAAAEHRTLQLFDLPDGQLGGVHERGRALEPAHVNDGVTCLAFAGDAALVSGGRDGQLVRWELGGNGWRMAGHERALTALQPLTGARLASACREGRLRLWDVAAGLRCLGSVQAHATAVHDLAAAPPLLFTASA